MLSFQKETSEVGIHWGEARDENLKKFKECMDVGKRGAQKECMKGDKNVRIHCV